MIAEVYDALRDAQGVSDDKARRAAEAVAAFDSRFFSLEQRIVQFESKADRRFAELDAKIDRLDAKLDLRIEEVRGTMRLMQWMFATMIAGIAALLLKAYS